MNRFRQITSRIRRALALQLRRMVQRRTASALAQLDDHALAVIGIPRDRIADYARELARSSVPVPPEDGYNSFSRTLTATPRMKST